MNSINISWWTQLSCYGVSMNSCSMMHCTTLEWHQHAIANLNHDIFFSSVLSMYWIMLLNTRYWSQHVLASSSMTTKQLMAHSPMNHSDLNLQSYGRHWLIKISHYFHQDKLVLFHQKSRVIIAELDFHSESMFLGLVSKHLQILKSLSACF